MVNAANFACHRGHIGPSGCQQHANDTIGMLMDTNMSMRIRAEDPGSHVIAMDRGKFNASNSVQDTCLACNRGHICPSACQQHANDTIGMLMDTNMSMPIGVEDRGTCPCGSAWKTAEAMCGSARKTAEAMSSRR